MQQAGEFTASGKRALHWVGPSFKDLTRVAGANPPMWRDIFMENRDALADSLRAVAAQLTEFSGILERAEEARIAQSIDIAAAYHEELLEYEDLVPQMLYKVTARIPDQPGVLSRVMTTLGDAGINIEDLTLHHVSRSFGGDLVLFVSGQDTAETTSALIEGLGYPTVVSLTGDGSE
jgi:prephenate dehydrogenase